MSASPTSGQYAPTAHPAVKRTQAQTDRFVQVHSIAERYGIEHGTVQVEPPDVHQGQHAHFHP